MPQFTTSTATLSSRASSLKSSTTSLRRQPSNVEFSASSSYLRPEDAFYHSPPNHHGSGRESSPLGRSDTVTQRSRDKRRGRSSSRRKRAAASSTGPGRGTWKKLLWVKQSYPDNYTDAETFLDHLQRNPRWRPYEFWQLVADSTIIVQHLCSVVIFVCCFTGIFQERVSPQTVVGWATLCTVASWVFRDRWQSRSDEATEEPLVEPQGEYGVNSSPRKSAESERIHGLGVNDEALPKTRPSSFSGPSRPHSRNTSNSSAAGNNHIVAYAHSPIPPPASTIPTTSAYIPPWNGQPSSLSPRMQERLMTAKSAILIYCSLLGLSPILRTLTLSTSSDSIWALSSWLMGINVFTFDYGAGPEAKFPASLSTNAALMASTVLASRLPSTTHVFSLTLFSIEVFGLFPVFRRHLRHHSWTGHLWLTTVLVVLASGGLSMTISGGGWGMAAVGVVLGGIITCLGMGMTSWWLIGLQRYKNEIHGPWDPARPIIRRPY